VVVYLYGEEVLDGDGNLVYKDEEI
jgi:hypothetical protein